MGEVYAANTYIGIARRSKSCVADHEQQSRRALPSRNAPVARVQHQNLIDIFDIGELSDGGSIT